MDKNVQRCNWKVLEGIKALDQRQADIKKKEEERFKKTLRNPGMLTLAGQNIKKLNANLKHHVLSSEYCEDDDPLRSKFIDVLEGVAYDT